MSNTDYQSLDIKDNKVSQNYGFAVALIWLPRYSLHSKRLTGHVALELYKKTNPSIGTNHLKCDQYISTWPGIKGSNREISFSRHITDDKQPDKEDGQHPDHRMLIYPIDIEKIEELFGQLKAAVDTNNIQFIKKNIKKSEWNLCSGGIFQCSPRENSVHCSGYVMKLLMQSTTHKINLDHTTIIEFNTIHDVLQVAQSQGCCGLLKNCLIGDLNTNNIDSQCTAFLQPSPMRIGRLLDLLKANCTRAEIIKRWIIVILMIIFIGTTLAYIPVFYRSSYNGEDPYDWQMIAGKTGIVLVDLCINGAIFRPCLYRLWFMLWYMGIAVGISPSDVKFLLTQVKQVISKEDTNYGIYLQDCKDEDEINNRIVEALNSNDNKVNFNNLVNERYKRIDEFRGPEERVHLVTKQLYECCDNFCLYVIHSIVDLCFAIIGFAYKDRDCKFNLPVWLIVSSIISTITWWGMTANKYFKANYSCCLLTNILWVLGSCIWCSIWLSSMNSTDCDSTIYQSTIAALSWHYSFFIWAIYLWIKRSNTYQPIDAQQHVQQLLQNIPN